MCEQKKTTVVMRQKRPERLEYLQGTDVFFVELVIDVSQNQRRLSHGTFSQ